MSTTLKRFFVFAVTALVVTSLPLQAAPANGPVADVLLGTTQVQWSPRAEFAGLQLTISGPNGTERFEFGPGESPLLDLASVVANIDGQYSWELRATPKLDDGAAKNIAAAARTPEFAAGERQRPAGLPAEYDLVQSGTFRVAGGAIVQPAVEDGPDLMVDGAGLDQIAGGAVSNVTGEQVITGDLTVRFSLCVGGDCANAESYGADTIRLKENNLRIHFNDTSNSASFPTTDWRIQANDSTNGGDSYLAFVDADAGRTPFRVDAGAPTNALRVESSGDIGLGTNNPVVEIHVVDGDSPTLRLEQDSSSGFAAQTWDLAGNETNFFVRDVNSGSTLPFRVFPGSGNGNAIVVSGDGDVGLGTASPSAPLHVTGSDGNTKFLVEENSSTTDGRQMFELRNNGGVNFILVDTSSGGNSWQILSESSGTFPGFSVSLQGSGTREFRIAPNGDVLVDGSVVHSSSRTVKDGFTELDPQEVLARVNQLPITSWHYKDDGSSVRHIGPMAEDFYATFGLGTDERHIAVNDTAGVALAAIQGLHRQVTEKDARIGELESDNAELTQRLTALEKQMERLLQAD